MSATPLLEMFKRGEAARDVKLLAAEGRLAPKAHEQAAILMLLAADPDADVRASVESTLSKIPTDALRAFLARADVTVEVREFFAKRGVEPGSVAAPDADAALVDLEPDEAPAIEEPAETDEDRRRESITQQLAKMGFSQRLKAAAKGSREMRAVLIRDPNKLISATVLSSPKITEQEIASFARMANLSEDVLRIIGSNRAWTKNYSVVVGLTKNPKTPVGMSLNFLARLNDGDVKMLSIDRNVPEALRIAARKKLTSGQR